MSDTTLDELCEAEVGVLDRVLPWRRRALVERAMQRKLDRMAETVNGIKRDHGLDDLVTNIERARAQGEAAMEKEDLHDDRRRRSQGRSKGSKP